ncbi:MAG: hypothetical protein ACR2LP_07210, partial [Candidatus Limnocylindrales bacterium]
MHAPVHQTDRQAERPYKPEVGSAYRPPSAEEDHTSDMPRTRRSELTAEARRVNTEQMARAGW